MANLRRNIIANFVGRTWASAMGLIFPPIYARLLGIESYGLIGVWASLTTILSVLDLGLSTTLNREIARYSIDDDEASHRAMRDMTRTIEVVFWSAGATAGLIVVLLAPFLSRHWVHAEHLSNEQVASSLRLIGVVFALQWPTGIYNGGLLGLQRQVAANVVQAGCLTIRLVGGALLLWKVVPSVHAFFVWQAVAMAGQTVVTGAMLTRMLPGEGVRGAFRWQVLGRNWRFSAGMSLISILSIVLMQADKIVVSKVLPLETFGYYTLAWTAAGALVNLISPVFVAVFPRLSQLAKQDDDGELSSLYHASCQLVSIIVLPAAAVLCLFSREVLIAWSGDPRLVAMASAPLALMAIGTALNGLMNTPAALMLAFGWTRLNAVANLIAVLVIVPLEYWLTLRHGLVGAAGGWIVLNSGYVLVLMPIMHRRLLRGELWRWYFVDIGLPLIGLTAVVVPIRLLVSFQAGGRLAMFARLVAVGIAAVIGAAALAPALRARGFALLARWQSLRGRG